MTKTQVESWNPATLTAIGNAWLTMGGRIEDIFGRYKTAVTNVNHGHWEGVAAEAALGRAESDRRAAVRLVDHLERAAQIAINGFHQVDPPLQRTRTAIAGAEADGFIVLENLTVFSFMLTPERQAAMRSWQQTIITAANETERADTDVRNALTAARAELRIAFTAPGSLGADQARNDADQLLDDPSKLTPEQIQRLIEAGSLTPDQLVALAAGDNVAIPASQMEYINALARSLDGKSTQDIENLLNGLPPEARKGVANALQLLSTDNVTASVRGDHEIPTNGQADLLPHKMYDSLTRPDLVTNSWETVGGYPYNTWNLNGVADNRAAARIAAMSDPTFKHGTGLDTAVMDAARQYLHAQNAADSDDLYFVDGRGQPLDEPITEEMFHAVADDRAVVADTLSGPNGNTLLSDVFTHEWSDNGKTISELFDISAQDAVADPNNRPDAALARQSGDIAESVAQYMSDNANGLLRMPDDPGTSAGERNPDLLVHLADDLAPYYSTFAGSESIPDVNHFATTKDLADMYSVLSSNPEAGVKAAQATYAQQNALAALYGTGEAPATYAQIAGQMQHALETGTQSAQQALDQGDIYRANWQTAVDNAGWDTAKSAANIVADALPGGKAIKGLIDLASPGLRTEVVGIVDPATAVDPDNKVPNQTATSLLSSDDTVENIVNGLVSNDPSVVNDPDLAPYRRENDQGNTYIDVDGLRSQDAVTRVLYEKYGIDVESWATNYLTGMHTGDITPAGR